MKPVLGVDYGKARIGLAISDELRMLAHPLETVPAARKPLARIAQIAQERSVETIVVGLPRRLTGEHGVAADEVTAFVDKLRQSVTCPVVTWDERLTTAAAHRALQEAGKTTRQTRGYVDQVAAQMILQEFLDQQKQPAPAD